VDAEGACETVTSSLKSGDVGVFAGDGEAAGVVEEAESAGCSSSESGDNDASAEDFLAFLIARVLMQCLR